MNSKIINYIKTDYPNRKIICIKGKLYDVTEYIDEHPGGADIIEQCISCDCTNEFYDTGHSIEAVAMLEKYYIDDLKLTTKNDDENSDNIVSTNININTCTNTTYIVLGVFSVIVAYVCL